MKKGSKLIIKTVILLFVIKMTLLFIFSTKGHFEFSFDNLKLHHHELTALFLHEPIYTLFIFFGVCLLVTSLPIPSGSLLAFAGATIFPPFAAGALYLVGYLIGVTISLIYSRYLFRDLIEEKFGHIYQTVNREMDIHGDLYLLSLRFMPIFPSFVINLVMGLTHITIRRFFMLSAIGRLPMVILYVNAGHQLGQISSLDQVLTWRVLCSFLLLALLPWILKWISKRFLTS